MTSIESHFNLKDLSLDLKEFILMRKLINSIYILEIENNINICKKTTY